MTEKPETIAGAAPEMIANTDGTDYLATAVVHFRVRGANLAEATDVAKSMFADALETSDLFGDGAVATVMAD